MTKFQEIYLHLKEKGLDVYSIGQKKGKCEDPYIVIKENSQKSFAGTNKVGYSTIDILIYYPLGVYTDVYSFKEEVKSYMKELSFIESTGNETPIIIDEDIKAYSTSIEYIILKKLS